MSKIPQNVTKLGSQNGGFKMEVPPENHIRKTNVPTSQSPLGLELDTSTRDRSSALTHTKCASGRSFPTVFSPFARSLPSFHSAEDPHAFSLMRTPILDSSRILHPTDRRVQPGLRYMCEALHSLCLSADPHALSCGSDRWIQRFTAPRCQQQLVGG
jgi:hypothetical protein